MLEGILLSECERLRQRSLANKLISLFRQFGGTELRLKLVWLCWLDLMTGNSLEDWKENLKRKSERAGGMDHQPSEAERSTDGSDGSVRAPGIPHNG